MKRIKKTSQLILTTELYIPSGNNSQVYPFRILSSFIHEANYRIYCNKISQILSSLGRATTLSYSKSKWREMFKKNGTHSFVSTTVYTAQIFQSIIDLINSLCPKTAQESDYQHFVCKSHVGSFSPFF